MAIGSVFREAKPSAPPVLIASFFTLAGPISPFAPPVVSPVPLRRRAEAAARAGFRGIGFTTTDLEYTLRDHPYGEIRRILADNGLDHVEIEFIGDWLSTPGENPAAHRDRNFIIASAAEIGAVHVKAGTAGPEIPLEVMIERFAALCDEARAAGAGVAIEFSPIGRIADLPTARALALGAGRERGGLLLDIWHLTRMGVNFADLAELPREIIVHVELSDGPSPWSATIGRTPSVTALPVARVSSTSPVSSEPLPRRATTAPMGSSCCRTGSGKWTRTRWRGWRWERRSRTSPANPSRSAGVSPGGAKFKCRPRSGGEACGQSFKIGVNARLARANRSTDSPRSLCPNARIS